MMNTEYKKEGLNILTSRDNRKGRFILTRGDFSRFLFDVITTSRSNDENVRNMAMIEILSVIEYLECWLHKKVDIWEDDYKKLHSLFSVKDALPDLREANKEKLYNILLVEMADFKKEKMKQNLYSLVVGMVDFWELSNKGKLYSFLIWVADPNLYCKKGRFSEEKPYTFLDEMEDLWEDDKGKLIDNEKLTSFVSLFIDLWEENKSKFYWNKMYKLLVDIVGFWKGDKLKLNKERLYGWLAWKVDLWEDKMQLFCLVLDVALHQEDNDSFYTENLSSETVKFVIKELRIILDFIMGKQLEEGSTLHYYIADIVEMAQDAKIVIEVKDSDPFILLCEIFYRKDHGFIGQDIHGFNKKVIFIMTEIPKMIRCIARIGEERDMASQNEEEMKGGEDVVGLDEDIELLLHKEDIGTNIFIRGMAGIGKTTLARALYNHASIIDQFDRRAWLCLSRVFSRRELLMEIIRKVVDIKEFEKAESFEKMDRVDNKCLKQMLHKYLQGKPYFIVLDDVMESEYLNYFLEALPQVKGSRLLFTTRSEDIACEPSEDYNHKIKFLDEDDSWKLLLKTILLVVNRHQEFTKDLEKKGKRLLKKCNGLPFAIKEMGRQWAKKLQSGSELEELLESMDFGTTLAKLESTYDNLFPQAKPFFLQLSLYKEGTSIRANKLAHIWKIVGVISQEEKDYKKSLSKSFDDKGGGREEGGDDNGGGDNSGLFLYELSRRSIIEVHDLEKRTNGIKTFGVNALFHRLSITKAKDELGFEILKKDGNDQPSPEPRHRVIYCSRGSFDYSTHQDKHIVSLIFHGGGYFYDIPSHWKYFEQLKILDMEDFGLKVLPDGIDTLIELRYLGLRNNYLEELPSSLGSLKKLEVLDIALNFIVKVPDIIWEIDSLAHLYMSDISFWMPLKIDTLKNLKTLSYISFDNWTFELQGLKMMANLHKLGIEDVDENSNLRKLFLSLVDLKRLNCLILRGFRFRSMPSLDSLGLLDNIRELKLKGRLTRLPSANNFPPNIKFLTLVNNSLDEDPMPVLENLDNLKYLKLKNAYIGQQMVISCHGFCSLTHLVIEELWQLRNVAVYKSAMQKLKRLEIISCPYLDTLPEMIWKKGHEKELKMVTSKNIAAKIRKSSFISMLKVDVQP